MVGGHQGDAAVQERLAQGLSVPLALDGRVALDAGAQLGVVGIGE